MQSRPQPPGQPATGHITDLQVKGRVTINGVAEERHRSAPLVAATIEISTPLSGNRPLCLETAACVHVTRRYQSAAGTAFSAFR
jgi:hypothetical protein